MKSAEGLIPRREVIQGKHMKTADFCGEAPVPCELLWFVVRLRRWGRHSGPLEVSESEDAIMSEFTDSLNSLHGSCRVCDPRVSPMPGAQHLPSHPSLQPQNLPPPSSPHVQTLVSPNPTSQS